jgi:hypothetical protein
MFRHTTARYAAVTVAVALSAGCATQPRPADSPPATRSTPAPSSTQRPAPPPPVNLSGYSAAFKQGYSDGCASASGNTRRDDARYRSDNDYMMGWSDGNSACRNKR